MNEIETLNLWLEESAARMEANPDTRFWARYYRGLKDIHLKESFSIDSGTFLRQSPLRTYLENHDSEYCVFPGTGSCSYTKK